MQIYTVVPYTPELPSTDFGWKPKNPSHTIDKVQNHKIYTMKTKKKFNLPSILQHGVLAFNNIFY